MFKWRKGIKFLDVEHFFHQQNVLVEQHSVLTEKRRLIITPKTTKRIC